ncbi:MULTISPECIES: MGMT family protein [unclassified Microbacterium]|uniref:MGMT family protein n=1 Tax=unclassified Microbacterium TaxID=2609290 RepID=UPI0009EC0EF1|nr:MULTISPECIES: MGMT family protein [unclassified Microbacterium]
MSLLDDVRIVVDAVPAGEVVTYGEVAALVGIGPQQAGGIVGRLDEDSPWWRVLYSDGTPASCHRGTAPVLLRNEKTPMRDGRVDIGRVRGQRSAP